MKTSDRDTDSFLEDVVDPKLKEEPNSYIHSLVDSEVELKRHSVFCSVMSFFKNSLINKKLNHGYYESELISWGRKVWRADDSPCFKIGYGKQT